MSIVNLQTDVYNLAYRGGGTEATLRVIINQTIITSEGITLIQNTYTEVTCSVSGTTLTIPSFPIYSTTNSSNPGATYTFQFYDYRGKRYGEAFLANAQVDYQTLGASTSWADLRMYNTLLPVTFYNYPTLVELILQYLGKATLPIANAARLILGKTALSLDPVNAANPIAVGNNDTRLVVNLATYSNSLAAAKAAIGNTTATVLTVSELTNVSTNVDLSNTLITLDIQKTGLINVTPTGTIKTGAMVDPGSRQVFMGWDDGGQVRFGKGTVPSMNLAWFTGLDAGANATLAFNQMFANITTNGSGTIFLPEGNWRVEAETMAAIPSMTIFRGCGNFPDGLKGSTIIAVNNGEWMLKIGESTFGISFNDLTLDADGLVNNCISFIGSAPNTSGYVTFNNCGRVRAIENGVNIDSSDGMWQVTQFSDNNGIYLDNGNAGFKCNSINGSYSFNHTNFSIPADGYGLHLVKSGALTAENCEALGIPGYIGTRQLETNTVVAAAGITGNGNAKCVVTGNGLTGSSLTVLVPVTTALTTPTLIATAFRTALNANAVIKDYVHIGGTGAILTQQKRVPTANDGSFNFTIQNDTSTGITNSLTSTQTTAGVSQNGMAEAVILIEGAHPPIVWGIGCQDEAIKHHTIFDASDLASVTKYDGCLVHADLVFNQSALVELDSCNLLSNTLTAALSASARVTVRNCPIEGRDQYESVDVGTYNPPQLADLSFQTGASIVVIEENPVSNQFTTRLPTRNILPLVLEGSPTVPVQRIGNVVDNAETKILTEMGRFNSDETPLFTYQQGRYNNGVNAGRWFINGTQTDFIGVDLNGDFRAYNFIATTASPAQIAANQNNYSTLSYAQHIRLTSNASWVITGLALAAEASATQIDGQCHYIYNVGASNIGLAHQSGSSTAANRIITNTGGTLTIPPNGIARIVYDATTARWRASMFFAGVIGTDIQAWSANLDSYSAVTPTAAGLTLLDDANAAAQLVTLGLTATATELNQLNDVSIYQESIIAAGALSVTKVYSGLSLVGAGAVTLAAPSATMLGQLKTIQMILDNGDVALSLANCVGQSSGTTATFNDVRDSLILLALTDKWLVVKEFGITLT